MTYESILESLLYYSPRFREVMKKIDHPISKEILNHEGENILPDITFIDIDDDGLISFSTMNNTIKKIKDFFDGDNLDIDTEFLKSDNDDIFNRNMQGKGPNVYTTSRNEIKIGKLVKKISGNNYKDSDIEKFVNLFKSSFVKVLLEAHV